jgi:hypothetical protein
VRKYNRSRASVVDRRECCSACCHSKTQSARRIRPLEGVHPGSPGLGHLSRRQEPFSLVSTCELPRVLTPVKPSVTGEVRGTAALQSPPTDVTHSPQSKILRTFRGPVVDFGVELAPDPLSDQVFRGGR